MHLFTNGNVVAGVTTVLYPVGAGHAYRYRYYLLDIYGAVYWHHRAWCSPTINSSFYVGIIHVDVIVVQGYHTYIGSLGYAVVIDVRLERTDGRVAFQEDFEVTF